MAVYPKAIFRNIPPGASDPPIIALGAILHVDAGNSKSLYGYFSTKSGGIESHFHVRKDGVIEQYRDTRYEADANYHANSFIRDGKRYGFVSIETQGFEGEEWTPEQLEAIRGLLKWLSETHNFPLRRCPAWDEAGVGYHVMFGAPGPWTPVSKSCPGPKRIRQYNEILVPWFKNPGTGGTPSGPVPGDLTVAEADRVIEYIANQIKSGSFYERYAQDIEEQRAFKDAALKAIDALYARLVSVETAFSNFATAEAGRYQDVAGRVQVGNDEERGRYTDYVIRFNTILGAVQELKALLPTPVVPEEPEPPKA